jgi:hypothetical protein
MVLGVKFHLLGSVCKDGMMADDEASKSTMDRVAFAVVLGVVVGGVYLVIGVTAHYLNVNAGPLPGVIAMLVGIFAVIRRNSSVKSRRRPEDHQ